MTHGIAAWISNKKKDVSDLKKCIKCGVPTMMVWTEQNQKILRRKCMTCGYEETIELK